MKNQEKTDKKQKKMGIKYPELLISLVVFLVIGFISRAGFLDTLEYSAYDLLLLAKPATEERDDIVIAAIDDASIAVEGTFPWPRDVLADAIIRMRELGAEQVSFDIEYLSPSAEGISPSGRQRLPGMFEDAEVEVSTILSEFSTAIAGGYLPPEYVEEETGNIIQNYLYPTFELLEEEINTEVFLDNDLYFAQALHFFGNSWLTINAADVQIPIRNSLVSYVREHMLLDDVTFPEGLIKEENLKFFDITGQEKKMSPALEILMRGSNGAGFTNIILDSDGTRRRVELLHEDEGQYIAQLVFAPILHTLNTETIIREKGNFFTNDTLLVKDALFPGETVRRDIRIPLDSDGRFLVNWIKDSFPESFKNDSVLLLHNIDEVEDAMIEFLRTIWSFRLGNEQGLLSYYYVAEYLLSVYDELEAMKGALLESNNLEYMQGVLERSASIYDEMEKALINDPNTDTSGYKDALDFLEAELESAGLESEWSEDLLDDYIARRKEFFEACSELTNPYYLDEIMTVLDSVTTDENRAGYQLIKNDLNDKFGGFTDQLTLYNDLYPPLEEAYDGSFVIVGHTASNSTDLGTTPFEGQYPNVGTHANVYNTIMNEEFITPISKNITILITFLMLLLYAITAKRVGSAARNITGIVTILVVPAIAIICIQFSYYIPLMSTLFSVSLSYVGILLWNFFTAESDKRFLRQSFETYLSDDVVEEIVASGVRPELGGEERNVTALFSDIKAFSSFSEQLSATQLVDILNDYLTALSDEILVQRGTIDKYIGDAIVAIFGAPIPMEDHAWRACVSAIRMKQAEEKVNEGLKEVNEQLVKDGKSAITIQTRIGLNTGDIVVGNMGTQKKMNYTMMGDDVNLAARLEGVNKKYSTWIIVSGTTWKAANSGENEGKLLGRRLDRVRVVGRSTPVQLYNIVGLKDEIPQEQKDCVTVFHRGLDLYLDKKFEEAKKVFQIALKMYPDDGPSTEFLERCEKFIEEGVPADWDGVLNMTSK